MIAGMGDMGSLMGMVNWMQQLTPQNLFGNMNPGGAGNPLEDVGNVGSVGQVPGVDFDSLRASMLKLQELSQARDQRDQKVAERKEKDLQEAKQDFFDGHHYEWPDGPEGEPKIVAGAEDAGQARLREKYERRKLEAYQDQADAQASTPNADTASGQLQILMSDQKAMQDFMQQPGAQAKLQELSERAKVEEEQNSIIAKSNEMMVTMPEPLKDDVARVRDQVLSMRADSYAELQATPEAKAVAEYQAMVQSWVAGMQGALTTEREDNWQPYKPQGNLTA